MKNKGFSLVELIVVIAIMAILVGVAVPVYTSYIEKTQKNKDIQMVDEIKHAIEIAAVGESWYAQLPEGGAVGTIVISEDGTTVSGDNATLIQTALEKTFGDLTSLKLSYDGWTGTLNAEGVTILTGSAYSNNVAGLLGTVQDVTDLFTTYLDKFGDSVSVDEDYFSKLGVDTTDNAQIANGMIVYVADQSSAIDEQQFIDGWCNAAGPDFSNVEGFDTFGQKAAEYAYVQALVDRISCKNETQTLAKAFEAYNTDYQGASPYNDVWVKHVTNCPDCQAGAAEAFEHFEADAKAYLTLLDQISASRDIVSANVSNNKLYEDSPLVQYVQSYVSVASLMNDANAQDGDIVLVVVMDAKGALTINAYPLNY